MDSTVTLNLERNLNLRLFFACWSKKLENAFCLGKSYYDDPCGAASTTMWERDNIKNIHLNG